jgi:hypothetical protein
VLVIGADSSPTHFSLAIRCRFHRGLEIGEFFHSGVSSSRSDSVLALLGGQRVSVGPVQAARVGEAGQARLGRFQNEARLGRLGWATQKMEKG